MDSKNHVASDGYLWKLIRFGRLLLIIIVFTWLFKSYLFSIYYIPSGSMSPTINPGDYILVSKFSYNLRTPEHYPLTGIPFPYFWRDGLSKMQRGDIVVFDMPMYPTELHPAQKENYIKRSVGLPGDTVLIADGRYYLQRDYRSDSRNGGNPSVNNYIKIPEKGAWISLSDSTKSFWEPILIRDGNEGTVDSAGNTIVNGKQQERYQIKQNYYFVRGDNPRFSSDSRSWGLVPGRNLIGRAEQVLWPWPPKPL